MSEINFFSFQRAVLERQKFERDDQNFSRDCLFCRKKLEGTRADALVHLSETHNLNLGRPDNLVGEIYIKVAQTSN